MGQTVCLDDAGSGLWWLFPDAKSPDLSEEAPVIGGHADCRADYSQRNSHVGDPFSAQVPFEEAVDDIENEEEETDQHSQSGGAEHHKQIDPASR